MPRRAAWAAGALAAIVIAGFVLVARVVSEPSGARPIPTMPVPGRVALVYAKPAGTRLIVGPEVIYVASPLGQHPRRLASGESPLLSPNGNLVAYVSYSQAKADLRLIPTAGGRPRAVGVQGQPLVWSWDSRLLAVQGAGGLVIVNARTLRTTLIRLPDGVQNVTFSPDGRTLAFDQGTDSGSDIYTVSSTGGPIRRLTDDDRSSSPLWGPGGIAFERFDSDRCGACGDVWLMNAAGGDVRRITHTDAGIYPAAWSANGRRLLAAYPAMHNGQLYAIDVASGRARPLTPLIGDLYPQGLSRNGRTVLAAIGCGGMISPYGVVETIPFAGGPPRVIARGPCRASSNF